MKTCNPKKNALLLVGLGAATLPAAAQKQVHKEAKLPNIVLLMTDQQRFDAVGYVNSAVETPNLDKLAQDGVIFRNAYTSAPSSTPARAGLLTGQSPWQHGMLGYGQVAEQYPNEMPRMLSQAGYYTVGVGKMHWFPQRNLHGFHKTLLDESGRVEDKGFTSDYRKWFAQQAPGINPDSTGIGWNDHAAKAYVLPERLHPTVWTAQTAIDEIRSSDSNHPLFIKISFARPHSPYDPPQRFLDMYANTKIQEPAVGDWDADFKKENSAPDAAWGDFGAEHAVKSRRHYYASVTFIDEQVGHIIQALKEKGIYDNTLILFTSDHGDMLGDHYLWRKTYAYEGSAHIPMFMKLPKGMKTAIKRGTTLDNPVELRDVLPTFLEATGIGQPSNMDGQSMLTLVKNRKTTWRSYIDMEHTTTYFAHNYWCALTDGKMKYIWFFDGSQQLFDLRQDPYERHDLSQQPQSAKELKLWRGRMVEHLRERGEEFVKNNELVIRPKAMLYSPNYPQKR